MAPRGRLPFPGVWPYASAVVRAMRASHRVLRRWEFWFLWASLGVGIPWLVSRMLARIAEGTVDAVALPLPMGEVSLSFLAVGALWAVVDVALIALLYQIVRGEREMSAAALVREAGRLALAAGLLLGSSLAFSWPWVGEVVMKAYEILGERLGSAAITLPFVAVYCWIAARIADAMRGGSRRTEDRGLLLTGTLLLCAWFLALAELTDLLFHAASRFSPEDPWDYAPFIWTQRLLHALGSCWLMVVLLGMFEESARGANQGSAEESREGKPAG